MISIRLEDPDGAQLPPALPGQYLTLRVHRRGTERALLRNYSLSGPPGAHYYRVSVKREPKGRRQRLPGDGSAVGDQLDIAAPRGTFILDETDAPVLLVSAGSARPLSSRCSKRLRGALEREIWWLHSARNGREHPFAAEARALLGSLPDAAAARLLHAARARGRRRRGFRRRGPPHRPGSRRARTAPRCTGIPVRPGPVHGRDQRRPREPGRRRLTDPHRAVRACAESDAGHRADAGTGASSAGGRGRQRPDDRVRAQRPRDPVERDFGSLLELAEACDVPVRWSCRTGVCQTCETTIIAGERRLQPRSGGAAARGERAALLLAASGGHRAGPVTASRPLLDLGRGRASGPIREASLEARERRTGIEPASLPWKGKALPLSYRRAREAAAAGGSATVTVCTNHLTLVDLAQHVLPSAASKPGEIGGRGEGGS